MLNPPTSAKIDQDEKSSPRGPATSAGETQPPVSCELSRGILALSDQIIVSGTSFATLAIIAHVCSKPEVGIFHLAWTIVGLLRTAQERMLSAPYLVFVHREGHNEVTWLGSTLVHQAIFAAICSVLVVVFAILTSWGGWLPGMPSVLVALACSLPFLLLRDHVRAICAAHFRYGVAVTIDMFIAVAQLGGVCLLATFQEVTIPRVAFYLGLSCLVPCVAWLVLRPLPYHIRRRRAIHDWIVSWSYSRWLVAARTIGIAGCYLVPWVVVYYFNQTAAGAFAACSSLVGLSLMFIQGANNFFQPRTVKAYHEQGVAAMSRSVVEFSVLLLIVLSTISAGFYVAGDRLMGVIYGPAYAEYGEAVFYLSLSLLAVSVSIACGNGLAALGQPRGYFWGEVAYFVATISLAFLLIPRWELIGAGLALTGGGCAASLVTALTLLHLIRQQQSP